MDHVSEAGIKGVGVIIAPKTGGAAKNSNTNGMGIDPDRRSYKVSFDKIRKVLGYETKHSIAEGAKEIWQKLSEGTLNPKDPRTITVRWYKHLIEIHKLIKNVEINNKIL